MDKNRIKKVITVYVPGNVCNLRCSYCYYTECLKYSHGTQAQFNYSVEHMINAFNPKRLGGIAYIIVIGGGETLIPPEVVPFVKGLLHQGHIVEVVTNNTLDDKINQLLDIPQDDLKRLIIKCSLHWNELKRLNKIDSYFGNIKKVIEAGASAHPFLVICPEYMPVLDEICDVCQEKIGGLPACTPCVTAETAEEFLEKGGSGTDPVCTPDFVKQIHSKFNSRLFEESVRFLDVDVRKVFCYAGSWGFIVEMGTGRVLKCHNVLTNIDFFCNIDRPIELSPVGCECGISTCCLQYPFFGLGLIPEIHNVPTYTEMFGKNSIFFNEYIKKMLNIKLSDYEKIYSKEEERVFLMDKINESNSKITKLYNMISNEMKQRQQDKEIEQRNCVETLLAMIDRKETSYNDLKKVNYDTLLLIRDICNTMQGGNEMYHHVWEKIVDGLFSSHQYCEPCYIYHIENELEVEQISKLSIVTFATEYNNVEQMIKFMKNKDNSACADLICHQMKLLC